MVVWNSMLLKIIVDPFGCGEATCSFHNLFGIKV